MRPGLWIGRVFAVRPGSPSATLRVDAANGSGVEALIKEGPGEAEAHCWIDSETKVSLVDVMTSRIRNPTARRDPSDEAPSERGNDAASVADIEKQISQK